MAIKMMSSLASLLIIIIILDTGQGQDSCRDISDGCSCLNPNQLRCVGKKDDLKDILDQIKDRNITALDVTLTNLTILEEGVFRNVQTLSALVISSSRLQSISKNALKPLRRNLTALSLPNNMLNSIPDEIFDLPNLNRLDLSQNQIRSLNPEKLARSSSLKKLDLSDNDVIDINNVQVPVSMEKFILKNNHLNFATISRFNLTYLKLLDLSHNKLNGTLSKNNFQFSNTLKSLDLSFNSLKKLTEKCFTNLPKLKNLNLESNEIEVINSMAFQGLQRLKKLDLSFNGILEIPLNVFNGLKGLEYLDLSSNHLQVVSGDLTIGLFNLDTLKLGHNDIIRIDPLKDVNEHLSELSLDSNPLECSCQMRPFQAWVQQTIHLSLPSKRSIRCTTPTKYANGILNNLDELSCDDKVSNEDIIPLQLSIPEEFSLLSKHLSNNNELNLKWQVNISNYTSDQVQLYRDDGNQGRIQLLSKPLIPLVQQPSSQETGGYNFEDINKTTVLEANFDLKKVGILTSTPNIHSALSTILVCATIIKADNHPLTNCTRVQLKSDPAEAAVEVTHNKNEASLASLDSIHAKQVIQNVIEVTFEVKNQSSNVECKINLLVEAGDPDDLGERVLATHISRCEVEKFTFHNLRLQYEDRLRVCAWLDFGPTYQHTNSKCSNVISNLMLPASAEPAIYRPHRPAHKSAPLLPLVLTLVFLGVGIATLVVLYLILKGYLSDRHKAELFRMRFCYFLRGSNPQPPLERPSEQGGFEAPSEPPGFIIRWTHRFFMWKRRRHHRAVPASDELSLREESTFDTSVA